MNYDDIPEWIKEATYALDPEDLTRLNFLKGSYIGQTMTNASLQEKIEELEEQVELARAYERERIAQYMTERLMFGASRIIREEMPK